MEKSPCNSDGPLEDRSTMARDYLDKMAHPNGYQTQTVLRLVPSAMLGTTAHQQDPDNIAATLNCGAALLLS